MFIWSTILKTSNSFCRPHANAMFERTLILSWTPQRSPKKLKATDVLPVEGRNHD